MISRRRIFSPPEISVRKVREGEREIMCESELSLSLIIAAFSSTLFEDIILKFSPIKSGMNPEEIIAC